MTLPGRAVAQPPGGDGMPVRRRFSPPAVQCVNSLDIPFSSDQLHKGQATLCQLTVLVAYGVPLHGTTHAPDRKVLGSSAQSSSKGPAPYPPALDGEDASRVEARY